MIIFAKSVAFNNFLLGLFFIWKFLLLFENNFAFLKDLEILGVPKARVVAGLYGYIRLFGEAGFLDRLGAKKYIIGNLFKQKINEQCNWVIYKE